ATEADGDTETMTAELQVHVTAVTDAPIEDAGQVSVTEDHPATIRLSASEVDTGDAIESFRVDSLPANGTLTLDGAAVAAGDVIDASAVDAGDLIFTPNENWSGNTSLTFSASDGEVFSETQGEFKIAVSPDADAPTLAVSPASGSEDQPIALNIDSELVDTDGSERLRIKISDVPAGAELSAGTYSGNNTWTLTPENLDGLTITPPDDFSGDFDLKVQANAKDGSDYAYSSKLTLGVSVEAVADTPNLSASDVTGNEDQPIGLDIASSLTDTDGSESLSVRLEGVPEGATLNAGTDNGDGTWDLTADQLDGLTVTAPENFSGDFELSVTATSTDGTDTASETATFNVHVDGVADAPELTLSDASGLEDQPIGLEIASSLTDTDGSESLSIRIGGVPEGATLNAGTDNGDGTWDLTADQVDGLEITPPEHFSGEFDLTVEATSTDGDDTATTTQTLGVTVEGVADDFTLTADDVSGSEDTPIDLDIAAVLSDADGSETVSVTISGVPEGATLSAGTDNGDGTWTLSNDQLDGLQITPPDHSDADFGLTVSATNTEADSGDATIQTTTFSVGVDAVADAPIVTVGDAGEDTITFRVSGDEYRGDPQMKVYVNGQQVGGKIAVTADYGDGEWQNVTITGDFGDNGPQEVEVKFTNDKWGGTADTDRNLYVDYIDVNGERFEAEEDSVYDRSGKSDIDGQERMAWNGKLVFDTSTAPSASVTGVEDHPIDLPIS
ncbi:MAG: Ig-like domain-containing protein, partial [Actinomycetota bacterium]